MFNFHHHHGFHHPMHGHHHGGGHGRGRGPKMFDAGAMRYVVLQLIAEKPRHGYDIIKELEQRAGGAYTPSPGAIYPLLAMLVDMGHVEVTLDGNKKLHTITAEGEAFLAGNRQLVDAVLARMGEPAAARGDLRSHMHALKEAVIKQARNGTPSPEKLAQIEAILKRAASEIEQLA
ncbi:PadR family transcriptional regulator [Oxalobacteraceae bacterium A2-2]